MKVCIPIRAKSENEFLKILKRISKKDTNLIEIWLDHLKNPDIKKIVELSPVRVIFVNRTKTDEKTMLECIKNNATYIDLDIEKTPVNSIKKLIKKKQKTKIILSWHNFHETPSEEELEKILKKIFSLKPDIAKIATQIKKPEDATRLLFILQKYLQKGKKCIIHGMGEKGKMSRIYSAMLGSEISYVALDRNSATAKGQWTLQEWSKKWKSAN